LETYSAERAPVAKQIVTRANKSAREFGKLFEALGIDTAETAEEMLALIESRKDATPEGAAKRAAVQEAMDLKNYEFNAHGVELGQHYASTAIIGDGTVKPEPGRDPELHYQPTTQPGGRLPHAWVGDNTHKYSTHDLAPYGQFTLFTGITGEDWTAAAQKVGDQLGVTISTVVIGPGREITDLYFDWAKLREVAEDGALLVRPDKHIAWRYHTLPADPEAELRTAAAAILNRSK
jgi:2,4-dichlorophenol 6-monooxygenase